MSRETRTSREEAVTFRTVEITDYACDRCGKKIDPDDWDGDTAHELVITLDDQQCVSFFRRRDYCPDCLKPIWDAINTLIRADPGKERDREYG